MRKMIGLLLALALLKTASGRQTSEQIVREKVDSIVTLVSRATDENNKVDLLLSVYTVSIDAYPVLLLETYQKLYNIGVSKKDKIIIASAWSMAGQGYRMAGNYVKALECHYKAIALATETGNVNLLSYARNQMAHIYKDRQENEKALALYRLASAGANKDSKVNSTWWAFMNMGGVYLNMRQLDSSLYYSFKAKALIPEKNLGEITYSYILSNIASVYSLKADNEKAMRYFDSALHIAEAARSQRYINSVSMAISEHFYRRQQYDSSVAYAKKAIAILKGTMLSNLALQPARMLAVLYESRQSDSALKYWKVYMAANDSLYSIRTNQQLMMMSFEETQRQRTIDEEKRIYRNRITTSLLLAGLGIFSLVALILFRNNKQKQKANSALASTLTELRSTQRQLIQSEKMASLGELTAGIAHEIQNPLNFVNNFSELSRELIEELKMENGKLTIEEQQEILKDLDTNLERINHHGKRADAIVKGMLLHSQSSSGKKEATDINKLADEYLRLSYHGIRAKDNSFNAMIKTDYDPSIGKINIVPQDIGRVIMNLLTNAFYAVNEKAQHATTNTQPGTTYEPTVSLGTKKNGDKIEITVSDNGNGIPQHIIDKIFQPFFTTRPTGQGTGLGLSLAYDIIKAHGGELRVEEAKADPDDPSGRGSTFIIQLPLA